MTRLIRLNSPAGIPLKRLGVSLIVAFATTVPLFAHSTTVRGVTDRSNAFEQRVPYDDLNLGNQSHQLVLVERVKKAAGKVCNVIFRGQAPMMKFQSRCAHRMFSDVEPQIEMAIANAGSDTRLAINLPSKPRN